MKKETETLATMWTKDQILDLILSRVQPLTELRKLDMAAFDAANKGFGSEIAGNQYDIDKLQSDASDVRELLKISNDRFDAAVGKQGEAIAAIFKDMGDHIAKVENEILPGLLEQINDMKVRLTMIEEAKPQEDPAFVVHSANIPLGEDIPLGKDGSGGVLIRDE